MFYEYLSNTVDGLLSKEVDADQPMDPQFALFLALDFSMITMYRAFLDHARECIKAKRQYIKQGWYDVPDLNMIEPDFTPMTCQEPLRSKILEFVARHNPDR